MSVNDLAGTIWGYAAGCTPIEDAHPFIDDLRFDSPLEQRFAWLAQKYFRHHELRSQVPAGRFRLDFVFDDVAFECDGFWFHSSPRQRRHDDERDQAILTSGVVTTIYRIPGRILHGWPGPTFATFAESDPGLFSDRGLINLEHHAQHTGGLGIVRKSRVPSDHGIARTLRLQALRP